jgi:hypothetical protein
MENQVTQPRRNLNGWQQAEHPPQCRQLPPEKPSSADPFQTNALRASCTYSVIPLASMDQQSLLCRSWNGTPISRRSTDGYVNATAMCKANGKAWNDYWRLDRATEYLEALSTETGIPVSKLCLSLRGGAVQGTWVHPRVAVDLARWISAPFAVWMDGWFLESIQQAPTAPVEMPPQRLREVEVIALVERSIGLFERLGGLDQRDQLLFKDIVRSKVLTASSGLLPGAPADDELNLSDAWLEVFQEVLPRGSSSLTAPRQV